MVKMQDRTHRHNASGLPIIRPSGFPGHVVRGHCRLLALMGVFCLLCLLPHLGAQAPDASPITIPDFRVKGKPLAEIVRRIVAASKQCDPLGTGVEIEVRTSDAHPGYADTSTVRYEYCFFNVEVADLLRTVCNSAQLPFRQDNPRHYVIGDGTASIDPVESRKEFRVQPILWQRVREKSGGKTESADIASFFSALCLRLPVGSQFTRTDNGTLAVQSTEKGLADCDEFLHQLDLLNTDWRVRLRIRRLRIEDPMAIARFRHHVFPNQDFSLPDGTPGLRQAHACDSVVLTGRPGEELKAVLAGATPRAEVTASVASASDYLSCPVAIRLKYREAPAGRTETTMDEHLSLWAGGSSVVRIPRSA
ncbi:MAG: hypothetical protein KAI66_25045, partial [Lentisphaeria bacterium]|nr:hypothetical protein [Lentisphaeria bacterium]